MDYSPSSSSFYGILQARILEWVVISFSRGSSWPKDWTQVSCIAGSFSTIWPTREAPATYILRPWINGTAKWPALLHQYSSKKISFLSQNPFCGLGGCLSVFLLICLMTEVEKSFHLHMLSDYLFLSLKITFFYLLPIFDRISGHFILVWKVLCTLGGLILYLWLCY